MFPLKFTQRVTVTQTESNQLTRIDGYETLCPQQMLVHKGGKIKNWVGSAEISNLQNCSLKIYLKRALGFGFGGGEGGQDGYDNEEFKFL